MHPKRNSPPGAKGSWRRLDALLCYDECPVQVPRCRSQAGAPVNNPSLLGPPATETARQRRTTERAAINCAAPAPAASLPPLLPPSKPCAEVADPPVAALREAVALPPGLDATSKKPRVNFVAAPSSKRMRMTCTLSLRAACPVLA